MSQTIRRRPTPTHTLPMVAACPAASTISGTCQANQGVICGVMQNDRAKERGLNMNARMVAQTRDGSDGVFLTLKSDPSTVVPWCHGSRGVPVVHDGDNHSNSDATGPREHYTFCPVWQTEKEREALLRRTLFDDTNTGAPETVGNVDLSEI